MPKRCFFAKIYEINFRVIKVDRLKKPLNQEKAKFIRTDAVFHKTDLAQPI